MEALSLTTNSPLNMTVIDPSWRPCVKAALTQMDPHYLAHLHNQTDWLPGANKIFNAFSQPINQVHYILLGESPYPRPDSANGFAFWDAAVKELWSENGLSKRVNRATSLRNIIKMLLVAEGMLTNDTSQRAIAGLDKTKLIATNAELFNNFLTRGFLLLNATLVLRKNQPRIKDARAWCPFMRHILNYILSKNDNIVLLLLGQIANPIDQLITSPHVKRLYAEHPFNLSFIHNQAILDFFRPLHLLANKQ